MVMLFGGNMSLKELESQAAYGSFKKIGKHPKMDGLFHGKPLWFNG